MGTDLTLPGGGSSIRTSSDLTLPNDLFVLQTVEWISRDQDFTDALTHLYDAVAAQYGVEGLISILTMVLSVRNHVDGLSDDLNETLLPTGDDGRLYFAEYCLSLPESRLRAYITNPKDELKHHRMYYVGPDDRVFEREGYLWYHLRNYINDRYPQADIEDLPTSDLYLARYHNILAPPETPVETSPITLPEDLFIFQTVERISNERNSGHLLTDLFVELDRECGAGGLIALFVMLNAVNAYLRTITVNVGEDVLPLSDDGTVYFTEYVLSLPEERLRAYMADPIQQITQHRVYYWDVATGKPYQREGYVWETLGAYIQEHHPDVEIFEVGTDQIWHHNREYLQAYRNMLNRDPPVCPVMTDTAR